MGVARLPNKEKRNTKRKDHRDNFFWWSWRLCVRYVCWGNSRQILGWFSRTTHCHHPCGVPFKERSRKLCRQDNADRSSLAHLLLHVNIAGVVNQPDEAEKQSHRGTKIGQVGSVDGSRWFCEEASMIWDANPRLKAYFILCKIDNMWYVSDRRNPTDADSSTSCCIRLGMSGGKRWMSGCRFLCFTRYVWLYDTPLTPTLSTSILNTTHPLSVYHLLCRFQTYLKITSDSQSYFIQSVDGISSNHVGRIPQRHPYQWVEPSHHLTIHEQSWPFSRGWGEDYPEFHQVHSGKA